MSAQKTVKPDAGSIAAAAQAATKTGLPPVHLWNPPFCGDLDMEIKRDGTWFYNGTPIGRKPLVKLFSSILKLEDGAYFLVTPVEKVGLRVEDAPFVAVDADIERDGGTQIIRFTTHVDDVVVAGPENAIRVERNPQTGEPSPYVHIRSGLEALIDRKTFYRLIDAGEVEGEMFGLRSNGMFFPVIPAAELEL